MSYQAHPEYGGAEVAGGYRERTCRPRSSGGAPPDDAGPARPSTRAAVHLLGGATKVAPALADALGQDVVVRPEHRRP